MLILLKTEDLKTERSDLSLKKSCLLLDLLLAVLINPLLLKYILCVYVFEREREKGRGRNNEGERETKKKKRK